MSLFQPGPAPPRTGIQVQQGDQVICYAVGNASGQKVRFIGNFTDLAGTTTNISLDVTAGTTRTQNNNIGTPLPSGMITGAAIVATANGPTLPGNLWCTAFLIRGNTFVCMICGGYVYGQSAGPTYPPGPLLSSTEGRGRIYNVAPTSPSAGAEVNFSPPSQALWRIMGINIKLVTSGVANNRTHHLVIDDGTAGGFFDQGNGETPAQTATTTKTYLYQPDRSVALETAFDANGVIRLPIIGPSTLLLTSAARIRTVSTLLDAGDQYSTPAVWVEEWITG